MISNINNIQGIKFDDFINTLDVVVSPFFSMEELDRLSREAGFVKRESKLGGAIFFELVVFNSENLKNQSLNDISIILEEEYNLPIAKQSLHERFNESAVKFLQTALEQLLQKQLVVEPYLLELDGINRILIKDSVCFQIDESLKEYYPGSGGDGSKAAVRIQFEYDLLSGKINDISLNAFNEQDASNFSSTIGLVGQGDLIIRDLAYVGLDVLSIIVKEMAFYLCRPSMNVKIYEFNKDEWEEINFKNIYIEMRKNNLTVIEKEVLVGKNHKIKTRLVIHRMPSEEVDNRVRKARLNCKKKGRNAPTKEYIARLHLNLFITNTDAKIIPKNKVWNLYRLRWQVELIFKIWKSICHIEKVKKVKKTRLECYIFSKLILIVMIWNIVWKIAENLFKLENKALSFYKTYKTLINNKVKELRDIFLLDENNSSEFIRDFYLLSRRKHLLEERKGSDTSMELLLSLITN